jgi:DnaK suppressor protein
MKVKENKNALKAKVSHPVQKIKKTRLLKTKKKTSSSLTLRERKIKEIKKRLIEKRKALLTEAISALNELPEQTVFADLGDQASAEIDRNFMLRLRGRERKLLKKIDSALERIKDGTFGICEKCGQEIDIRRLEARPVTTMCIECKTQQEEEEKLSES